MSDRPSVTVPLDQWTEELIKRTIQEHANLCPVRDRVEKLELRVASLIAFMIGSGTLGGLAGALLTRMI